MIKYQGTALGGLDVYFSWILYSSTRVIKLLWSSMLVDMSAISSAHTEAGHLIDPNWNP